MNPINAGNNAPKRERVTVPGVIEKKRRSEKIVAVTTYDFAAARIADRAGVDIALVGDTLGIMALGYPNTVSVTLDETLHHVKAVRRGLKYALLLADMPFGTYQAGQDDAVRNAARLLKEGEAQAVKLEGGAAILATVQRMTDAGIPVCGHLGLTPQSIHAFGGNKAQGKTDEAAQKLLRDAKDLQEAGAFALVLEAIPAALAALVTAELAIPTIGIGAGPDCDGQVQVWHDLMGIYPGKSLRHTKRYAEIGQAMEDALRAYAEETRAAVFPTQENSL